MKIGYFEIGHDYDVTVTSFLGCWYLFIGNYERRYPKLYYGINYLYLGISFSSSYGVVTTPLIGRRVTKRFGKTDEG